MKIEKTSIPQIVMQPITVNVNKYVLELTETEARVLHNLVGSVIGGGKPRTVTSDIYFGLQKAGLKSFEEIGELPAFVDVIEIERDIE